MSHPYFNVDVGLLLQSAHRIAEGQVPYRDFFSFYGPVGLYVLAGAFRLLGENELTLRIVLSFQGVTLLLVIYMISRLSVRSKWLSILPVLFLGSVVYPPSSSYIHHVLSGIFGLCALLVLLPRWGQYAGKPWELSPFRSGMAGFLSGVSFLTLQSRGSCVVIGVLCSILVFHRTGKLKHSVWAVLGFLLPLVIVTSAAIWTGALRPAWEDVIVWPLAQYAHTAGLPYYYYYEFHFLASIVPEFQWGLVPSYAFVILAYGIIGFQFLLWVPIGVLATVRTRGRDRYVAGCLFVMGSVLFLSGLSRPDASHIGQADLLGMIIWTGGMKYIKRFSAGAKKLMIGVVGVVSLIWAVGGVLFTPAGPLYTTPRGEIRGGSEIPEVASFLNAYHPKKNEVFLLTSLPHVYWLFSLENPLPWDMLVPGFHSAGQVAEVVRQLRTVCPEWMIMDWGMENIAGWGRIFWPKIDRDLLLHNPLMPFLSSQYIRTSSSASVRIYHRKRDHCE